jgi:hypothetical protein
MAPSFFPFGVILQRLRSFALPNEKKQYSYNPQETISSYLISKAWFQAEHPKAASVTRFSPFGKLFTSCSFF